MDDNSKIGKYLFNPFFDKNDRPKSNQLLNSLKKINFNNNSPIAVLIYSNAEGNFENIQLINSFSDYPIPFDPKKGKPINKTKFPTKTLLLL